MEKKWIRFPNGRVWCVIDGIASGTVAVPDYETKHDREARLDAISEAAVGGVVGLMDFSYEYRGCDVLWFSGSVQSMVDEESEELLELEPGTKEWCTALAEQYNLTPHEIEHACQALDRPYVGESVLPVWASARDVHYPPPEKPCSYVRIVVDGLEVEYLPLANGPWAEPSVAVAHLLQTANRQG